jgi:D-methionine transport system ATP-binding protein
MGALVRIRDVSKRYGDTVALDHVTLDIEEGGVQGVIGYSGAGKSTLVRLINGLERPTEGRVLVGEDEISALPERRLREIRGGIGMIFQQFNLFRSRTVAGNVAYPLTVAGMPRADRDRTVARLLDFVGLLDRAHQYPEQLSGGQKQRVGIARALARDPRILLADEATSALDPETTSDVLALLDRVNRELGVTIVLITHEMDAIRAIADRVAVMEGGRIIENGDLYDVFATPTTPAAARFVRTVLHDRPSRDTLARLHASHHGRLVTIRVPDRKGFTAELSRAFAAHGVGEQLVFGGISEIAERPVGALTYALDGADDAVHRLLETLRSSHVDVVEED